MGSLCLGVSTRGNALSRPGNREGSHQGLPHQLEGQFMDPSASGSPFLHTGSELGSGQLLAPLITNHTFIGSSSSLGSILSSLHPCLRDTPGLCSSVL